MLKRKALEELKEWKNSFAPDYDALIEDARKDF